MNENMIRLQERLRENSLQVEKALGAICEGQDQDLQIILDAQAYSLLGGGKRIRPFLTNEICRALGGDVRVSMPFACALEMIHTYSLIHDDLPCMDDDDMRRGKPANHKQFGYANALLAGDALLTKAFLTAASNEAADDALCREAVRAIAQAAGDRGMIGGQIMDLAGESRPWELEKLLRLHAMKTGALIACAARLGCLSAGYGEDTPQMQSAVSYAQKIGIAFQVIDDILDVSSTAEELGKSVGGDADHNKTTFLTYFNMEQAKEYASKLTAEAVASIADWQNADTLIALAQYLLDRTN